MSKNSAVTSLKESEDGGSSVEYGCKSGDSDKAMDGVKSELDACEMSDLLGLGGDRSLEADGNLQANNTDEDQKPGESSDSSDHIEAACDKPRRRMRSGPYPVSKNLVSERKRRKKLNEGLYSLRALVPKISKMDKASIVGDAIEYVRDLQKQVEDLESDISYMQARMESDTLVGNRCQDNSGTDTGSAETGRLLSEGEEGSLVQSDSMAKISNDPDDRGQQQIIMQLEVVRVEGQIFQLRVCCKRGPGVVAQLMEALEGLGLEVLNANLTSFQESIHNTFIAKISNWEIMESEDSVKSIILDMAAQHGLLYGDPGVINAC